GITSPVAIKVLTREGSSLSADKSPGWKMPAKLSAGSGVGEGVGRGDGERVIDGDVLRAAFSRDWLSLVQAMKRSDSNRTVVIAPTILRRSALLMFPRCTLLTV